MIVRILHAGRTSARDFLADSSALAATEFAMIVPLMLVMFFGTVEVSTAVAIDRKVTLIARTLSDLTSQSSGAATDTSLQNTFTASISIVTPYDASNTVGTISEIYIDANSIATVQWSKSATVASSSATQATLTTSLRKAGDKITSSIPSALLVPSTYLILSEVSYTYKPTLYYVLKSDLVLSDVSYTRPRQVTCIAYNNVPSSC
ncbi:pilus assembly protein TadG [Bradyrhizobium sp. AS23.2]|nr:pilus assembly protein TadG [Bradyrhizobium sp. AS23.2]